MNSFNDFQNNSFEQIIEEYNNQIKERKLKTSRIFKILLVIYVMIMILLIFIFPGILKEGETIILYCIFGGIAGVVLLVGLFISLYVSSEKPFHNFIMKEMVDYINHTNNSNLMYTSYPKKEEAVNKRGGLFTRGASMDIKNKIEGNTDSYSKFTWYNMRLYTTDGKNQFTLFNGMYFVLEYPVGRIFQVRTHSKPKLKGTKFNRVDEENPLRIYVVDEEISSYVDDRFLRLVADMKTKLKAKKVYLAAVNNEIHFAFEGVERFKKPKNMNKELLYETLNKINATVSIPNEIVKMLNQ